MSEPLARLSICNLALIYNSSQPLSLESKKKKRAASDMEDYVHDAKKHRGEDSNQGCERDIIHHRQSVASLAAAG